MTSTMIQHPIARIQAIIGEIQDATQCNDHERKRVMALWAELENHILMVASPHHTIAGIIGNTSPPNAGQQETTDADTDSTSRRGHRDRGSGDSPSPGDQTGPGASGDPGSETD